MELSPAAEDKQRKQQHLSAADGCPLRALLSWYGFADTRGTGAGVATSAAVALTRFAFFCMQASAGAGSSGSASVPPSDSEDSEAMALLQMLSRRSCCSWSRPLPIQAGLTPFTVWKCNVCVSDQ